MGGALRGVRLRAGPGGRQPVEVGAADERLMPVVTAHAGGGGLRWKTAPTVALRTVTPRTIRRESALCYLAALQRCAALLRAAVPAGAQRKGLNVHLPRESRPLEVAAEV